MTAAKWSLPPPGPLPAPNAGRGDRLSEDVAALTMADEGPLHSHVHQHFGAHLPLIDAYSRPCVTPTRESAHPPMQSLHPYPHPYNARQPPNPQ
jgi:hypothetical protein